MEVSLWICSRSTGELLPHVFLRSLLLVCRLAVFRRYQFDLKEKGPYTLAALPRYQSLIFSQAYFHHHVEKSLFANLGGLQSIYLIFTCNMRPYISGMIFNVSMAPFHIIGVCLLHCLVINLLGRSSTKRWKRS